MRARLDAEAWSRTPHSPLGSIANVLRSSLARPARNASMRHSAVGVPSAMTCVRTTVPDRVVRRPALVCTSQVTVVPTSTRPAKSGASDMCHSPLTLTKQAQVASGTNVGSAWSWLDGWVAYRMVDLLGWPAVDSRPDGSPRTEPPVKARASDRVSGVRPPAVGGLDGRRRGLGSKESTAAPGLTRRQPQQRLRRAARAGTRPPTAFGSPRRPPPRALVNACCRWPWPSSSGR